MPRIGPLELVLILVIVLLIFGAGKLPEIGKALGKSIREFKKAQSDEDKEEKSKTTSAAAAQSSNSHSSTGDKGTPSEHDSP